MSSYLLPTGLPRRCRQQKMVGSIGQLFLRYTILGGSLLDFQKFVGSELVQPVWWWVCQGTVINSEGKNQKFSDFKQLYGYFKYGYIEILLFSKMVEWILFFLNNFCVRPYVPREPRRNPSNCRFYEHGIWYISNTARNQTWQPVPSQVSADPTRPQWRTIFGLSGF